MAMYVYSADGHPVGFTFGTFIHDLDGGAPLGRILGSHVFRMDGVYVGEFFKETVVEKPVLATVRDIQPMTPPPHARSPGASFSRRVVVNYGFPDAFYRLHEVAGGQGYSLAAE